MSSRPVRSPPHLPTRIELLVLGLYPALLLFGALFSFVSPETRASPYDPVRQSHYPPEKAPSYFARKDNILNVFFVKRGWAWVTIAFFVFWATHPAVTRKDWGSRIKAVMRWASVTTWWIFVTQWFFGPGLVDRGFMLTGGRCEREIGELIAEVFSASACKASGGKWKGGHDISGHVFLLVLGSYFLIQEVGWVVVRSTKAVEDERCVLMDDGAIKSAAVEAPPDKREDMQVSTNVFEALAFGGKFAAVVIGLSVWMLLMTAIYFHTWFEKLTGLLTALAGLYFTYILPRYVPALRWVIGLPGF